MGLIAPPTYISPPGIEPHRFGLFSVARFPDVSERWNLGVQWEPLQGGVSQMRPGECIDDYSQQYIDIENETSETLEAIPFVVTSYYRCKSAARSLSEAEERARLALAGGEERAVETFLMNGIGPIAAPFAAATVLAGGDPISLRHAFGEIEHAIATESHSCGVIHLPTRLSSFAHADTLYYRYGQKLETPIGNYVSVGGGYDMPNVSPTGVAPSGRQRWVYGTGHPSIVRGEVFVQPDETKFLDRDTNDVVIMAQREYLVYFDGPVVAALVDIEQYEDCGCQAEEVAA